MAVVTCCISRTAFVQPRGLWLLNLKGLASEEAPRCPAGSSWRPKPGSSSKLHLSSRSRWQSWRKTVTQHGLSGTVEEDCVSGGCGAGARDGEPREETVQQGRFLPLLLPCFHPPLSLLSLAFFFSLSFSSDLKMCPNILLPTYPGLNIVTDQ